MITKGHAFAGVWLQPQEFSQLITDEVVVGAQAPGLKELLVFETTLATRVPAPNFTKRWPTPSARSMTMTSSWRWTSTGRACSASGRWPGHTLPAGTGRKAVSAAEALEEAPMLPGFDVETASEPDTPAGKLTLWQRKLLDLTTRNRLLHLPEGAKAIRLVCPEPAALEDRLADGKRIRVVAMPDLEAGGRDAALYEQQNRENLREAYGRHRAQPRRGGVDAGEGEAGSRAGRPVSQVAQRSRRGRRQHLFLALGFLQWKRPPDDPKSYSAPLILVPVKLERKSALSGVTLSLLEDEPRFNLTLLELLRHDFELASRGSMASSRDENGIDIEGIWNIVRRAVRDVPGFEVTPELVLGTFSFAKYLMWKDLAGQYGAADAKPARAPSAGVVPRRRRRFRVDRRVPKAGRARHQDRPGQPVHALPPTRPNWLRWSRRPRAATSCWTARRAPASRRPSPT